MKKQIKDLYAQHLTHSLAVREDKATDYDRYKAMALSIRDLMVDKWLETKDAHEKKNPKFVYYISLEYLIGRAMGNALINLDIYNDAKEAAKELGFDLEDVREQEVDAGLGNGGLGRLAACFLDSMATLDLPAVGYGIRYDYGIFKQVFENGYQTEEPDNWMRLGNPWEICRPESSVTVRFYGRSEQCHHSKNPNKRVWVDAQEVQALPYDTPIPGYKTNNVNTLRLWSAKSSAGFNLTKFNQGDYVNASINDSLIENISKVLYPNDNNYEGKELRLKQQYFLVSSTLQDIIRHYKERGNKMKDFDTKSAIQLNDTHPALAVPELMRLLIDEEDMSWDAAWEITRKSCGYTNHTLMSEALEKWSVGLFAHLLPRHLEIIYEINHRFMRVVANRHPGDHDRMRRMSIIDEDGDKSIRMAYLSIVGTTHINGVAGLHTKLLEEGLFKDFYEYFPENFVNVTNGITPRRWLKKCNPGLSELITKKIGGDWAKNLDELKKFEKFAKTKTVIKEFQKIKKANKQVLADYILENNGVKVNVDSIFDVQVKRLHEYKRQLLNILHAVTLYLDIKDNPTGDFTPRTIMFGAKAAPGYYAAKQIIKLINNVADVINNDDEVGDKLKVVFLENYRVSLAEKIIPATDLSEQISLAGTEASGTGNMKFALNGALTIGTMDGANVEIHDNVGEDNIFIFGMNVQEVKELRARGYHPHNQMSPRYQRVLDLIRTNFFSPEEEGVFDSVLGSLDYDHYMLAADFDSYYDTQQEVATLYKDNPDEWTTKAIINMSNMGWFSSDRTIDDYAKKIWDVKPVPVK